MKSIAAAAVSILGLVSGLCGVQAQENPQALKILRLINKIEWAEPAQPGAPLRREVVSGSELNAYIKHRIDSEKEEIMKGLELKLGTDDRIEGKAALDLSRLRLPAGLPPQMDLYFSGKIQAADSKIKLWIESLYLERQKIPLMLLDLIISMISEFEGTQSVGLQDWHDLPYGIKSMSVQAGNLIIFY